MAEGQREHSEAFSVKALIPFMRTLPRRLNHLPKDPLPNIITLDYVSTYEFWGDTNIQSIINRPVEQSVWSVI